jgi:hypothetical protein
MVESGTTATVPNYWGLYEDLGTGAKNYLKNSLLINETALVGSETFRNNGATVLGDISIGAADGVITRAAGLQLPANIGIGTAVDTLAGLYISAAYTDPSGTSRGIRNIASVTTTASVDRSLQTSNSIGSAAPAVGTTNSGVLYGHYINAYCTGAGTLSSIVGAMVMTGFSTGSAVSSVVTESVGVRSYLRRASAGTITTYKAFEAVEVGSTADITNYWGFYEELGTGAKNYLKNALLIGTTVAVGSELLRIAGGTAATPTATDVTAGGGSVRSGADSYFAGVRVGLGGGAVSTNTCVGNLALDENVSGVNNVAVGYQAAKRSTGSYWTAIGDSAKATGVAGNSWVAIGRFAGLSLSSSNWVAIGISAGRYQSGGTTDLTASIDSVFLGYLTKGTQSASNEIAIGASAEGKGSNTFVHGNTSITNHYMAGSINMVTDDSYVYLRGDATTDGSVRVSFQSGTTAIEFEKRISGSWVSRHSFAMPD